MRRALAAVLVGGLVLGAAVPAAEAHGWGLGAAIVGLATFAVFAPIVIAGTVIAAAVPPVHPPPPPVYAPPPIIAAPAPAYAAPTPAARPASRSAAAAVNVVQYANGRYVLRGDGVTTAYQWVWIPNAPPPPPPPAHPPQ